MKKYNILLIIAIINLVACKKNDSEIILDKYIYNIGADKGSINIKFNASLDWTATVDGINNKWCTLSSKHGQAGAAKIIVTADTNQKFDSRTAVITIKSGGGDLKFKLNKIHKR